MLQDKRVAVLGSGIAGLSAADELARRGIQVTLIEKSPAPGGHAAQFSCKAVDGCVQCGACLVQERMQRVLQQPRITLMSGTQVVGIQASCGFELAYAVDGDMQKASGTLKADALLLTTGFAVCDPSDKPYGYGKFKNVVTNLEAERILRAHGGLKRPSDGKAPGRIAFIQCVGSRDKSIGHNWCSKICCGSALRMARLIQKKQPGTAVTFFYIDVQTFGRNFQTFYPQCRAAIQTIRAVPGDIVQTADSGLQLTFYDPQRSQPTDQHFDMVILSTGLMPSSDHTALSVMLGRATAQSGFFPNHVQSGIPGLFAAGAALGPMTIAESIDSAGETVCEMVLFLEGAVNQTACLHQAMRG